MFRQKLFLTFAVFLFFLLRVEAQSGSVCVSQDSFHIVVLGSSTARGTGAEPISESWVNRYERYLKSINPKSKITNLAQGSFLLSKIMPTSWTPTDIPAEYPDPKWNITMAISLKPDAIIIAMASNDASYDHGVENQLSKFKVILDLARNKNIPVWVATTQPKRFDSNHLYRYKIQEDMKDTLKAIHGVYSLDFWTGLIRPHNFLNRQFYRDDSTHLNNDGHNLLFQRVVARDIPTSLAIAQDKNILVSQLDCYSPASIEVKQSEPGIKYKLQKEATGSDVGSPLTGNNNALFFQANGSGVYKIIARDESKNCERELSARITVMGPPSDKSAFPEREVAIGDSAFVIVPVSEENVTYQLMYSQGGPSGAGVKGTGNNLALPTGILTATTTFKIRASNSAQCSRMLTNDVTVKVIGAPQAIEAYAEQSSGCGPFSTNIRIDNTDPLFVYQLRNGESKVKIGQPAAGNGRVILLATGTINVTTTIEVLAKNENSGTQEVSEIPIILSVNNIPSDKNIKAQNSEGCGNLSTFIRVFKSDNGIAYVLRNEEGQNVHLPVAGTGGDINLPSGLIEKNAICKVIAINSSSKCERELNTPVSFMIYELPKEVLIQVARTTSCEAFSSQIVIQSSQPGVKYRLYKNEDNRLISEIPGNGNTLSLPIDITGNVSTFKITASNGHCEREFPERFIFTVNQVKAEIFQKDDTLKASSGDSFQWFLEGSPLKGRQENYLLPVENGNYSVAVFYKGCSNTSKEISYRITGDEIGIRDIGVKIFPNPTSGKFILQFYSHYIEKYFIRIYNHLGQVIHLSTLEDSGGEIRKDLDLEVQPQGLYHIVINDGKTTVKRSILKI